MRARISLFLVVLSLAPASAEDAFVSSLRLRGGYDSNPLLAPDGKGAAFSTLEGALAAGRKIGDWTAGVTLEMSATKFSESDFTAFQNHRLRLRLSNENIDGYSLDSTTTFAASNTYDTRVALAAQRAHFQYVDGKVRPFVAGDLRLVALNEVNPLLGGFLPEPMRFLRGSITPGIAYVNDKTEAGVSLALTHTTYEGTFDLFGFRRDNDRMEVAAYAKREGENLSLAGAISFLRVASQEEFFTDVNAVLFQVSLTAKHEDWSGEVSLARTAEDTTFPISPVTINTALQAKLVHAFDEKTNAGVFGRVLLREYWDSPFFSRMRVAGVEITREIAEDLAIGAELGFAKSLLISGAEADGVVATIALTKRFGTARKK